MVDSLVLGAGISISLGDLDGIQIAVDHLQGDRNLAFLQLLDSAGNQLALPSTHNSDLADVTLIGLEAADIAGLPEGTFSEIGSHLFLRDRINFEGETLGTVIVGLSITEREATISDIKQAVLLLSLALAVVGIGLILYLTQTVVIAPINRVAAVAEQMATGNLTVEVGTASADEVGQFLQAIGKMASGLRSLIGQTQQSGIQITSSVTRIAASGKELEATVNQQAASTNQVVSTAKEISATSQDLVSTMSEVSATAEETTESAASGQQGLVRMENTMRQMENATQAISAKLVTINDKAVNITSVVTTITKVADQTNLLSLNAAIEAEKAGEYGMGFAVVAREIRRLADQTAVATLDIEQTVQEMKSAVSTGVMSMEKFTEEVRQGVDEVRQVGVQLTQIISQVQALTPRFESVSEGMEAQSQGARQISDAMVQLNEATQQTAASLGDTNRALKELTQAAHDLQKEISHFKAS